MLNKLKKKSRKSIYTIWADLEVTKKLSKECEVIISVKVRSFLLLFCRTLGCTCLDRCYQMYNIFFFKSKRFQDILIIRKVIINRIIIRLKCCMFDFSIDHQKRKHNQFKNKL